VKERTPKQFGSFWSILFLPMLFFAAAVSVPVGAVAQWRSARSERRFRSEMEVVGRTLDWQQFIQQLYSVNGTLIVERFSFKGPIRWWWTGENVFELCPSPLADWLSMSSDEKLRAGAEWCWTRFVGPNGEAKLVIFNRDQMRSIHDGLTFREGIRWVEVPHLSAYLR
jgi:hypothetical protein